MHFNRNFTKHFLFLQEAKESLRFYLNLRGNDVDPKVIEMEMDKLKNAGGSAEAGTSNESSMSLSDFLTNPGRKAMIISLVLCVLNQFSGCFAILNYTANVFKEAGSGMSPSTSAMIVGAIQLVGSFTSVYLIDRAGRRVNPQNKISIDRISLTKRIFFLLVFVYNLNDRCDGWLYNLGFLHHT